MERLNLHATALVVGDAGLLVFGPSGSGKSLLAHHLIGEAGRGGAFAALVCDDRVWVSAAHGRLIAEAPAAIAGLLELRGYGPARMLHEPRAVIDRVVSLVEPSGAPRLREAGWEVIAGVRLPCLRLAAGDTLAASAAIAAWLRSLDLESS